MNTRDAPKPHPMETRPDVRPDDVDLSLLQDSLALTPWERMQANDDAVNFAESLHAAMRQHHAKSD
jgi:hypothetical protein